MPFYEYQCKNCGHDLEAMQKINDPPLKKCPHCGKAQLQRLMSAPVFRLKGGGWYETDFKGDQDTKRNLADRPEAEAAKETAKDAPKEGAAAGAEGKGKEGNGKDAKGGADGAGVKESASKESASKESGSKESASRESGSKEPGSKGKTVDKPAEKASGSSEKKAGAGKLSKRSHTAGRGKSAAKRPIKRPVHKATRRG